MTTMCAQEIEEIIELYGNSVYRFALSITKHKDIADDIYQEVFLRYLKNQPTFESEEHAKAWFLHVTKNCCRSHFMSSYLRHNAPLTTDFPFLVEKEYGLYFEVMKLPLKYRRVLHLYYYEGYDTQAIATLLKIPSASVRTQLKRGRERLIKDLEGSDFLENL